MFQSSSEVPVPGEFGIVGSSFFAVVAASLALLVCLVLPANGSAAEGEGLLDCSAIKQTVTSEDGSILTLGQATTNECGEYGTVVYDNLASPNRWITMFQLRPNGTMDPGFSNGRIARYPVETGEVPLSLIPAAGGKTVLATSRSLRRINADGTSDTSFAGDGVAGLFDVPGFVGVVGAAAAQSGGKIVVASVYSNENIMLARFNADGSLDETFGTDGIQEPAMTAREILIAIDDQDRIVLGGIALLTEAASAMRLLSDGSPDSSFGPDGNGISPAPAPPVGQPFETLTDIFVSDQGRIGIYGEAVLGLYSYWGVRNAFDEQGDPDTAASGRVGTGHSGHGFAELPGGDAVYSVFPERGETGDFKIGREPGFTTIPGHQTLSISPTTAGVGSLEYSPRDNSIIAGGTAYGITCRVTCDDAQTLALAKIDATTGELKSSFGRRGLVSVPENICPEGEAPPLLDAEPIAWNRCRVKPPQLKARVFFKAGKSRRPGLKGNVFLNEPPRKPSGLTQTATIKLPDRLKLVKGKLRRKLWAKDVYAGIPGERSISVRGRTIKVSWIQDFSDFEPEFDGDFPPNNAYAFEFGVKPGALRKIPRKQRRKKQSFEVKGSYETDGDRFFDGNFTTKVLRARPGGQ